MNAVLQEARPTGIVGDLLSRYPGAGLLEQATADAVPTLWVPASQLLAVLKTLKRDVTQPYRMLYDLTAIDERQRRHRDGQPAADFTVVYLLTSLQRNADIRIKVALSGDTPHLPSITALWANADWYEREVWDLFGIVFDGHPHLVRIMMPRTWEGHPLRKDHYARATEAERLQMDAARVDREQEALRIKPEEWGMKAVDDDHDTMILNLGPNHPSVHGVFRVMLQLDGEEIVQAAPDIGYHHRGAEKMGERQSWHSYIPYTDRIDYLGGVMNNLPYLMAIERMAGIPVPPRAQTIRVMLCEFFRITSHLLYYGTYAQDVGSMSPVFYMFVDRQKAYDVIEAITGFRMHPAWFRIGGVAADLPIGWDKLVREFLDWMPKRLVDYDKMALRNSILKRRSIGVGEYDTDAAIEWGVTGPGLRATGCDFDYRKARPYSGYEQFEFDVPTGKRGDVYDRCLVRVEEIRQSLRIIEQCLNNMPAGDYKARHSLATPPIKDRTMQDIETLIHHFLSVSWGPVVPAGECMMTVEATKGLNSYYLTSDGGTMSYRTRIRTPSFAHLQMIPAMARGVMVPDLIAIIASIDFVMADVDR
ncbi:NADH-quinone oxidoreductase subunit C/D [Sinimarinibacterium sp. CAU 1509]|uniref:NADH-quinone oxidoreductase subunit C/D n=1 Tax=Sinimarinibacterium sp. CAU 1509 TaxID=2562283 RepID=UPI0010AB9D3E|nr:NADH-quinone oxidoreductase subunit C/D [Sinimarinibacterium sp. CAU 1509]TJY64747.1 NADH-quinone oxidoreductase subunit C/D [Sinimarinibacterium sp. CAU 1509]